MLAEIHHKVSLSLEDELTGNFFGIMRYIPFTRGLKMIFSECVKSDDARVKKRIEKMHEDEFHFEFWKRSEFSKREIDAYMVNAGISVGIEVKYQSGLSGEEQLEREAAMLKEWTQTNAKILLLVAGQEDAKRIYEENKKKEIFQEVGLSYMTWQDIYRALDFIDTATTFEQQMIEDLKAYLFEKGFSSFQDFSNCCMEVKGDLIYEFG